MFRSGYRGSQRLRVFVVVAATARESFGHGVDGDLWGAFGILIRIEKHQLAAVLGVHTGTLRKSGLASDGETGGDSSESTGKITTR
jgi:hypothetical protein